MTNFDVYLADAKTVAIAGHVRPDGDCAGSCLATYNYIKNYFPHVKVDLYLEPIPNIFKFMKRSEEILSEWPDDRKYDLFIAQDCGDAKRLGNAAKYFESAEHTICVDHHVSNQNFAEHNYIFPDASSTCELIFELLPDERIDREIAECIYTGMVHDTGVFQYSCTSRKTMEIAGKLIEKGINFPKIVDWMIYFVSLYKDFPASVTISPRCVLSNNWRFKLLSSELICLITAGAVIYIFSAALLKLPASTTHKNVSS